MMVWTPKAIRNLVARTRRSIGWVLDSEDGVTAIEYGIIVAGISVAIIAAVSAVGENLVGTFEIVFGALDDD